MNLFRNQLLAVALISMLMQTASADEQSRGTVKISPPASRVDGAKLSLEEARKIALANASGDIVHEKLDKMADSVCYSFDIKDSANNVKEVLVDGNTGQVVIVEKGPSAPSATPHLKVPSLRPH
ncbi:MAG: hypothetical protein C5B53_12675 [Candidatus Melainabacteria bacterium]|nr:MAG: hypothetical protein C5B53_12675 [Candidatus Melainabacteria bacterium]